MTALIASATSGCLEIVEIIIAAGALLDVREKVHSLRLYWKC